LKLKTEVFPNIHERHYKPFLASLDSSLSYGLLAKAIVQEAPLPQQRKFIIGTREDMRRDKEIHGFLTLKMIRDIGVHHEPLNKYLLHTWVMSL
jgi:hypothetical protein